MLECTRIPDGRMHSYNCSNVLTSTNAIAYPDIDRVASMKGMCIRDKREQVLTYRGLVRPLAPHHMLEQPEAREHLSRKQQAVRFTCNACRASMCVLSRSGIIGYSGGTHAQSAEMLKIVE